MNKYAELASQLEQLANPGSVDLEKIASLCLLYMYSKCEDGLMESPSMAKVANQAYAETEMALELGINMGIQAFLSQEV